MIRPRHRPMAPRERYIRITRSLEARSARFRERLRASIQGLTRRGWFATSTKPQPVLAPLSRTSTTSRSTRRSGRITGNPTNHQAFPAVSFANDNYSGWDSTKNWNEWHDNGSLNDSLVWIHRAHSFKFGYIYEHLQVSQQAYNTQGGTFAFNRLE